MIVKIFDYGKSPENALTYALGKENSTPLNFEREEAEQIKKEMAMVYAMNGRVDRPALHAVISLPKGRFLLNKQLTDVYVRILGRSDGSCVC